MPIMINCPHCRAAYPVADALHGQRVLCRACRGPFVAEGPSCEQSTDVPAVEPSAEGFSPQPGLSFTGAVVPSEDRQQPAIERSRSDRPLRRPPTRNLVLALVTCCLVAGVVFGMVTLGYPFLRDRYNLSVTEANWERIKMDMTLPEVESIFGMGQLCPITDMKPSLKVEDMSAWSVKLGVVGWYRWRNGDTLLFVGVDAEARARFACLLTQQSESGIMIAGIQVKHGEERPTGKSAPATLPEEKLVEAYIREKAGADVTLEFNTWGPHDLTGELQTVPGYELVGEQRRKPVIKLRVRYWARSPDGAWEREDNLYYLQEGKMIGSSRNGYGDEWLQRLRDRERRLHPGK